MLYLKNAWAGNIKAPEIMISIGNTSGIKESDAIKIDAILKGLKCSRNTTVINEVQTEQRRYFEYEIVFWKNVFYTTNYKKNNRPQVGFTD